MNGNSGLMLLGIFTKEVNEMRHVLFWGIVALAILVITKFGLKLW